MDKTTQEIIAISAFYFDAALVAAVIVWFLAHGNLYGASLIEVRHERHERQERQVISAARYASSRPLS